MSTTTDDLALAANAVRAQPTQRHRQERKALVEAALREGMHPWAVSFYSGLSEGYVRSLVPAVER